MNTLKALTFATPPAKQKSPLALRRAKLIARLEQQKLLAENPLHVRVVQKWIRQDNGEKALVELPKRLQPWWRTDETGTIYLKVRCGARAIEFERGKPAILVKDKSKLASIIDTLIAAINAGELDEHFDHTRSKRSRLAPNRSSPLKDPS